MNKKPKRIIKKRKRLKISASFLDPSLKSQLSPSIETQIKHKLQRICYGRGKTRDWHQSWLDTTNSFLQSREDIEKLEALSRTLTPYSLLLKKKHKNLKPQKPMFILISENEVQGSFEKQFIPYNITENYAKAEAVARKFRADSQKNFKKYAPLPLKKFDIEIEPPLKPKVRLISQYKSLKRFKF
ncbi:hypothetical protein SteCoe_7028 [Stentor coeruleus]|uniref:Uncharacterized protein n=1 Tax=Stentor coeruleus TaxID=5963 RepID=A0A1R2CNM9_9CILI|nr:hypothetical protein SteCoe_7028 [Stentor coeruleus]